MIITQIQAIIFLSEKHVAIFPKAIKKLYDELIPEYEAGAKILLGIGLRALVEAICIDQLITGSRSGGWRFFYEQA
jgi:hypothetical protein